MTGSESKNSSGRMIKPGLRERLKYHFDNFMSRGTLALISGLGILSRVVVSFVRWELHTRRNKKPGYFITRLSVPVPPSGLKSLFLA